MVERPAALVHRSARTNGCIILSHLHHLSTFPGFTVSVICTEYCIFASAQLDFAARPQQLRRRMAHDRGGRAVRPGAIDPPQSEVARTGHESLQFVVTAMAFFRRFGEILRQPLSHGRTRRHFSRTTES